MFLGVELCGNNPRRSKVQDTDILGRSADVLEIFFDRLCTSSHQTLHARMPVPAGDSVVIGGIASSKDMPIAEINSTRNPLCHLSFLRFGAPLRSKVNCDRSPRNVG